MKNDTLRTRGAFLALQTVLSFFPWNKRKKASKITMKINTKDQERYACSFPKKKLLHTWKMHRHSIQMTSLYPLLQKKKLYEDTYNQLKPLLLASYREDFHFPQSEFTFQSWLQYLKLLTQLIGKHRDTCYWGEISDFISQCAKLNIL